MIGRTVRDNLEVFGSWEDMHVDIWGPRTGKTTSRAVPAILDAPGAVVATSNKRDIVDATRGPRSEKRPGLGVRPAGGLRGAAQLVVEPADLHHRRDQGARDGRALRRLAAPERARRPTRSSTPPAPTCWPACCSRRRSRSARSPRSTAGWPTSATTSPSGSCATPPACSCPRTRCPASSTRRTSSAPVSTARPSRAPSSWSTARSPAGSPRRGRTTPARSSTRTSSSARAARCTACPRKAPVRRARWSPR